MMISPPRKWLARLSCLGIAGVALLIITVICFGQSHSTDLDQPDTISQQELDRVCGVNCLYLISRYYGLDVSYDDLNVLISPNELGTSMLRLKQTAEQIGLDCRSLRIDPELVLQFSGPLIARVTRHHEENTQIGHFVVLYPNSEGAIWVLDPPHQPRTYNQQDTSDTDKTLIDMLIFRPH